MKIFKTFVFALLLAAGSAQAVFDPVHQDIDIFMTNPSISSERPNVLIILDTSANWQTYFSSEKTALISVVNGLTDQYNVGLATNAGGSIEGSYLRYAVRQMTSTNKTALSSLANDLNNSPSTSFTGDKTNNAVPGLSMAEAYRYFKGLTSYSATTSNSNQTMNGHDPRTDYAGNTVNTWITNLSGNAFSATPTVNSTYTSPVTDGCQKNFIIYISNGKGSNQVGEKTTALDLLATAMKNDQPTTGNASTMAISPLSPTGDETDSWFDEWAKFLARTGFSMNINGATKTVTASTYVVEVQPGTQSADLQWTATLKSGASNGNGKYYAATGTDPGTSLLNALNSIFSEIQAVNSVFASTTLPVSVNVRGTNLNQVYIGMFRPDANKAPRWLGNLKLYKLALNGSTLELQDAAGVAAESKTTGFIVNTARSYWTHDSSFWSYRSSAENGIGGQSDSPDGDLVEKGAVAQRLREAYVSSQSARNVYTCTTGSYANCNPCSVDSSANPKTCNSATTLSTTPFSTANTDITAFNLGLGTKDISSLTAKVTKTVSAIADRRNVTLNNSTATAVPITAINNGATLYSLSSVTSFDPSKTTGLSKLTGSVSTAQYNISNALASGTTVTLMFDKGSLSANPCATASTVTVNGNNKVPNGTYAITSTGAATYTGTGKQTVSAYAITFTVSPAPGSPNNGGTVQCASNSAIATATVGALPAGLAVNSWINISGAYPTAFNGDFQVTAVDTTNKTFSYAITTQQGDASTFGTVKVYNTVNSSGTYSASGSYLRVRATAPSNTFAATNGITITGVTPAAYNGSWSVSTIVSSGSTFTFDIPYSGIPSGDATVLGGAYRSTASTTVTVTTSGSHNLVGGTAVDILGINQCFNVTSKPITYVSSNSFSYQTNSICDPIASVPATATVAASTYGPTVTVTLPNHGFANGASVAISDGTNNTYNNTFPIAVTDSNTFTFSLGSTPASGPSGQYTARLAASPLAYVTAVNHGFSSGDTVTIAGSITGTNPGGYDGTWSPITVIDANTFSYVLGGSVGTNTSTSVTASKNTTTAVATSPNHGFADQSSVVISGATPSGFNGTFTINYVDANTFTYTIGSPQGDATGTLLAAAGTGTSSERDQIINWVRGQDNAQDENLNGSYTDCRASVHGDVLHSRPAVINYNRYGGDNDVYVYYGANDGVFHGIKGGVTTDATDTSGLLPGQEAWGFVPPEVFTSLKRMRNNAPQIGSSFKRPYFMDGPIGVYSVDGDSNGKIEYTNSSDHVYLYVGARRGGRFLYSLDVTNPQGPKFRWKIDSTTSGYSELGYTWSQPTVVTGLNGYANPVLIFGGGYDPDVEDVENCTVTSTSAASYNSTTHVYTPASVTYNAGTVTYATTGTGCSVANPVSTNVTRRMGRAIYVVDAVTGQRLWWASYPGSGADLEVTGMDYAIPSDVTVIKNLTGGYTNRAYVGDTGGNMWRLDFNTVDPAGWTVTKIASIADQTTTAGRRKFLAPPDVVGQTGYDAVMVGTGDREHPFDNTVVNNFYLFKDHGNDSGPGTGTTYSKDNNGAMVTLTRVGATDGTGNPVINHTNTTDGQLYNATNNCVQQACTGTTPAAEATTLAAADGWYITLGTGEKVIGNALALNGIVFFNTNQPSQTADASCQANLGIARQYEIDFTTAGAALGTTAADRATVHPGGGFLPSPVHVVVQVEDASGNLVTKEGVISGTSVQTPTTGAIGTRTRRFWYKEID